MEFSNAYSCHTDVHLSTGRPVTPQKLVQSRTYEHMHEGQPDKRSNDNDIEAVFRSLLNPREPDRKPYVIKPARLAYFREPGDRPKRFLKTPEFLPPIRSIGRFSSHGPARDETKDYSEMTIVRFRAEYGLQAEAVAQIMNWIGTHTPRTMPMTISAKLPIRTAVRTSASDEREAGTVSRRGWGLLPDQPREPTSPHCARRCRSRAR